MVGSGLYLQTQSHGFFCGGHIYFTEGVLNRFLHMLTRASKETKLHFRTENIQDFLLLGKTVKICSQCQNTSVAAAPAHFSSAI